MRRVVVWVCRGVGAAVLVAAVGAIFAIAWRSAHRGWAGAEEVIGGVVLASGAVTSIGAMLAGAPTAPRGHVARAGRWHEAGGGPVVRAESQARGDHGTRAPPVRSRRRESGAAGGDATWAGREFEAWCADRLRTHGWIVRQIGRGGDQGVDLLAWRGGVGLVIQCKGGRRRATNAAVQQVFAGRAFHGGHRAMVVSAGGFTPSARLLAARIGVRLLGPFDLDRLQGVIDGPEPPERPEG